MSAPFHFIGSQRPLAQALVADLVDRYGQADLEDAVCVVAVGGDGTTLKALQAIMATPHIPVFSMRVPGSVGALGNRLAREGLTERIPACRRISLNPLQFESTHLDGSVTTGLAINEVAVVRRKFQATRVRLQIGARIDELFGDGVVVASPIGSTGYCSALGGPRLPVDSGMLAIAGIAVRMPAEGYRMAAPAGTVVRIEIVDPVLRPARQETCSAAEQDLCDVTVWSCNELSLTLLHEPGDFIPMGPIPVMALASASVEPRDAGRDPNTPW